MNLKELPFSMKPVGWFQVGWSNEIPNGGIKSMRYFGEDLVAFRSETGELSIINAHCHHLGAHLGYGGKVVGNELVCPYHGWRWSGEGENTHIPYQETTVNKRLKTWHNKEQHGCIFMWHDPTGAAPRWGLPHIFDSFRDYLDMDEAEFYPVYPHGTRVWPKEEVHPQITFENSVDSMHFRYVHNSPLDPELLEQDYREDGSVFRTLFGFRSVKHNNEITMTFDTRTSGVGSSFNVFKGSYNYRVLFSATPVDDTCSDLFNTIWWPRKPDDQGDMPEDIQQRIDKEILTTVDEDLVVWRHQTYVDRPLLAKQDVKAFTALRKWQAGFYNLPAVE